MCKTRYSTFRTVLDQIGAHGLNTVTWRLLSLVSKCTDAVREIEYWFSHIMGREKSFALETGANFPLQTKWSCCEKEIPVKIPGTHRRIL
jgi:hypothetical protein